MEITKLYKAFFKSEKSGGMVLIGCTAVSLLLANYFIGQNYVDFWNIELGGLTVAQWVNDGLMTIFFLLIGLELEREIYIGELKSIKNAALPIFAAIGGMLIPAGFYLFFNSGSPTSSGFGIPMATDIAFSLGVLSLLGKSVPTSVKIFLTALAVIDDLGAIIIIALFYSHGMDWASLSIALGIFIGLILLNRLKVYNLFIYLILGIVMWYFMLHSGVHPTITGILLAFAIPFRDGGEKSPSYKLQEALHYPVAFIVLPIFAIVNTAFIISGNFGDILSANYSLGIFFGLLLGKPLGIFIICLIVVSLGICKLPGDLSWRALFSVGILAGIGFTMSIFVSLLAFSDQTIINNSKLMILITSLMSGVIGYLAIRFSLNRDKKIRLPQK